MNPFRNALIKEFHMCKIFNIKFIKRLDIPTKKFTDFTLG